MKLLVFALYAQCRADAGRMVFGQSVMAYGTTTREALRLFTVVLNKYTLCAVSLRYGLKIKPILRCV